MSLTKILLAPVRLFIKEVITFLIIRRYDLGMTQENLRFISVKPNASISVLRQKVWHLLDLPDYCEEIIILKSPQDVEIPLTELRKGNDPQHPYYLEVWLPEKKVSSTTSVPNNMLTILQENKINNSVTNTVSLDNPQEICGVDRAQSITSNETIELNKRPRTAPFNLLYADFKKSEMSCKISSTSIFKINGRRSKDNVTGLLLKIQNDLTNLSSKLSDLENRIPT